VVSAAGGGGDALTVGSGGGGGAARSTVRLVPHEPQKRVPVATGAWQFGQVSATTDPLVRRPDHEHHVPDTGDHPRAGPHGSPILPGTGLEQV
jgi:hypothetical protein